MSEGIFRATKSSRGKAGSKEKTIEKQPSIERGHVEKSGLGAGEMK